MTANSYSNNSKLQKEFPMKLAILFIVVFSLQSAFAQEAEISTPVARIKRMEKRSKKDGQVSAREKKKINHAQNRASRSISKKKHNKR